MKRIILFFVLPILYFPSFNAQIRIEQWSVFELTFKDSEPKDTESPIIPEAEFFHETDTILVHGFYDGGGTYKIRFMPYRTGEWGFITKGPRRSFHKKGAFVCTEPKGTNHGPVRVVDTFWFEYADGTPYHPMGTTIYRWLEQENSIQQQTLESLKNAPFNKARFKILGPNSSGADPAIFPFKKEGNIIDYAQINPKYFHTIDSGIIWLQELGIEADLIFLHPYDRENLPLDSMTMDNIYRYLDYIIARFGAYRNIWWTTNEFDLLHERTMEDWDNIFAYFEKNDPYHHLRSNHNSLVWYDHTKPWITHASVQTENWWMSEPQREKYQKPVIFDEFCYEGDGANRTVALNGNILTHRFWMMTVNGGFATHGEAFIQPETGIRFFSKGGKLIGNSYQQLKILKNVIDQAPGKIEPMGYDWRLNDILCGVENEFYLYYFGVYQNASWTFTELPENIDFTAEIIDTQTGEAQKKSGTFKKDDSIELPGKTYMAIVLRKKE